MNYGVYIFNSFLEGHGTHNGATWFPNADDALSLFAEACRLPEPRVMICDSGDNVVAEAVQGVVSHAKWALLQAPVARRKVLADLPKDERQCAFCKEVFLESLPFEMGESWEREQHLSGCCSDACWERGMGAPKTMRFGVELIPFGDGAIREVRVPAKTASKATVPELLDLVFKWGQNEKQPQLLPSVSVGDVIWINGTQWRVLPAGFELLHPEPVAQEAFPYDDRDQT